MSANNYIASNVVGALNMADGTPATPLDLDLGFDTGDFTCGPLKPVLNETVPVEGRGRLRGLAPGARIYPSGSFSCHVNGLSDATADQVTDMVLGIDKYSGRVSTMGDVNPFTTFDLTFTMAAATYGNIADDVVVLTDCEVILDELGEGQPNTVSFSYVCYGTVTINGVVVSQEIS